MSLTLPITDGHGKHRHGKHFNFDEYSRTLLKQFGSTLRVVAVPNSLLLVDEQERWSGPIITILREVAARLPSIKTIQIVRASTVEEANELLLTGQVSLNITPQNISQLLLRDFAAIAISSQPLASGLVFPTSATIGGPVCSTDPVTLSSLLAALPADATINQIIVALNAFFQSPNVVPGLLVVDSTAQRDLLVAAGIAPQEIFITDTLIRTPNLLRALLTQIADEQSVAVCNIAFIGSLPLSSPCFLPVTFANQSLALRSVDVGPANGEVLGWTAPKYAPKFLYSLQSALDAWIAEDGVRPISGPALTASLSNGSIPIVDDAKKCEDDEKVPYPTLLCILDAPTQFLSTCRRYIPDYAIHELFLNKCVPVEHPISIVRVSDCGDILY